MTRYTDLTLALTESGRKEQDRNSVSCVVTVIGKHCLREAVATQTTPPPSSSDAEFGAQVKGASVETGMQSMARDSGRKVSIRPYTVLTASKGIANTVGQRSTSRSWNAARICRFTQVLGPDDEVNNKGMSPDRESMNGNTNGCGVR